MLPHTDTTKELAIEDVEIVVPRALQMGWTESPPFFCAGTETARDVAEDLIGTDQEVPEHPLDYLCTPPDKWEEDTTLGPTCDNFIKQLEVYVDDFMCMAQATTREELTAISRRVLHAIHCVFPPLPYRITKVTTQFR